MITLALVRHAKSDWSDPGLDDHDRPLADRGRRDAPRMAAELADRGFRADLVLSSTAERARATAEYFADELRREVHTSEELYAAPADTLMRALARSGAGSVLLVGHDPGISELASRLSRGRIEHMPTCAVATFEWDADDWDAIEQLEPTRWSFHTPR